MTYAASSTAVPTDLGTIWAEVLRLRSEVASETAFRVAFVASIDDQVSTAQALKITGIKSRTTLIAERDRPGSLLTYTKHGRSTGYSRASCVAYRLSRTL